MALPFIIMATVLVLFVLLRGRKAVTNRKVEEMARRAVEEHLAASEDHTPGPNADKSEPTE